MLSLQTGVADVRINPRQLERIIEMEFEEESRRTIDFPEFVRDMLGEERRRLMESRALAGARWQDIELVFPSEIGTPLEERNVLRRFQKICEANELLQASRHTALQLLPGHELRGIFQSTRVDEYTRIFTTGAPHVLNPKFRGQGGSAADMMALEECSPAEPSSVAPGEGRRIFRAPPRESAAEAIAMQIP